MSKRLCLNMIVKNEIANLDRCLHAMAPYISCWLIGDTGSTDGTQKFIRDFFAKFKLPGILDEFPFNDFSQARNEALVRARQSTLDFDYIFFVDADMELVVDDQSFGANLNAEAYQVLQRSGVSYWNTRLLRRDAEAEYKGVTHEFINIRDGNTRKIEGLWFRDHGTGGSKADKFERDARLLRAALSQEIDVGMIQRYTFYLANTLRDAGQNEPAISQYLKRAELGGWQEEVYLSLLGVASLMAALNRPEDEVLAAYSRAAQSLPARAEALHDASRYCRTKTLHEQGYELARNGLAVPFPKDGLFVQDWIYSYGLLDEFVVHSYWTNRFDESLDAAERLLSESKFPSSMRERVETNRKFAADRLTLAADLEQQFGDALRKARWREKLQWPENEVLKAYEAAATLLPERIEALHGAARYCRFKGQHERGYQYASRGVSALRRDKAPHVERWIYEYGLLDELGVHSYWVGHYAECADVCSRLLSEGFLPEGFRDRISENRQHALNKLSHLADTPASPMSESSWKPDGPLAGTELMVTTLRNELREPLKSVQLEVNLFPTHVDDTKPLLLWMHHDINQNAIQWCRDDTLTRRVRMFIFVSHWQRERYQSHFGIPPEKCVVLRNATFVAHQRRIWHPSKPVRFAYTSVPFRGLSILLKAWQHLNLPDAELHIWSSMRLYGRTDNDYDNLIRDARDTKSVFYRGLLPNHKLKQELRSIHFLAYPSTFEETSCLAAIDAMSEGCRLIVPALGALPETTGGFAHVYPWSRDENTHCEAFKDAIRRELTNPWDGAPERTLDQQNYCEMFLDWRERRLEWTKLLEAIRPNTS